jgi:hypothetical protein
MSVLRSKADIRQRESCVRYVPEADLRRPLPTSQGDSLIPRPRQLFEKESQHFAGGIRAVRVCVGAICATAGPGMTTSVDEPLLDHHSPGLVSGYRAGMGPARGGSGLRALHAVICLSLRLYDFCGI